MFGHGDHTECLQGKCWFDELSYQTSMKKTRLKRIWFDLTLSYKCRKQTGIDDQLFFVDHVSSMLRNALWAVRHWTNSTVPIAADYQIIGTSCLPWLLQGHPNWPPSLWSKARSKRFTLYLFYYHLFAFLITNFAFYTYIMYLFVMHLITC